MTRSIIPAVLLVALLHLTAASAAEEPAIILADGDCQAPFVLLVPAEIARDPGGLTVVAHDDGAGSRLSFTVGPQGCSVTLHRPDGTLELGRAEVPLPAGDDAQIVLKRKPGGVAIAYGEETVLRAEADLPDGGRWGIAGGPREALDQIMFQPVDEILFGDDFMRVPDQPDGWEHLSGDWRVAQLESAKFSTNAFTLVGSSPGDQPALATAGYWFWEDMTAEASVQATREAGGFGIGLACQPDGSGYLLRFLPERGARGVLQLVRVQGAEELVLAEAPAVAHPDEWHRLAISGVGGRVTGVLDGLELLTAEVPELAHGQIALWVRGSDPVAFDDVVAYSGPRRDDPPVTLSYQQEAADPNAQVFINDQYMQEWADERDQWLSGTGGLWHSGYYWGDVELAWEMPRSRFRGASELHICVPPGEVAFTPPSDPQPGCHLAIEEADGKLALTLREGTEVRGEASTDLPEATATITLRRRADTVEVLVGDGVVASFETTLPAAGKVGMTGGAARMQASGLRIVSRNVVDATFRSAPTDWHIGSGEWGVSSRWDCTPRWSWFQGRSEDLASVWTRQSFSGDMIVEFFAGISMDQPWAPFYRHPGNLCVTLGGSNDTPGSGYSFIVGGWGNTAAGIFRRGELVAQAPGFVLPDVLNSLGGTTGREDAHKLHNEWWRIRVERIGATVRLLVDGKLAATFEDPDPLPGGAVGIWTLDQAMTVARARIYYQQYDRTAPPIHPEPAAMEPLPLPEPGPAQRTSTFESGADGWGPAIPGSCAVTLEERDGGRCLAISSPVAGGRFALATPLAGVDLRKHPVLAFDYAVPDDVIVDLFATVRGQRYRIALTGPDEPAPGIEDAGRVADVQADGRWHQAQVDLLGMLLPFLSGDGPMELEALEFAAYAAPEYARAGIGGNPAGATWRLDSVALAGVRDLAAPDRDAPVLEAAEPQPDARWLGRTLAVRVADSGPAGIDERSLELRVGERRFRFGDPGLRWSVSDGLLSLDLREAGLTLAPGRPVSIQAQAADRAGNRARALKYTFTPEVAADAAAPDRPVLAGLPPSPLDCDFEAGAGPLEPWGVDAAVELRRARNAAAGNAAGGEWCLEARCTKPGGLFGLSLGVAPFDASRFPVLEFDYRVSPELRVDLIVEVDGSRRIIKFTDNDGTWRPIGSARAVADGEWQRAAIDLQTILSRAYGRSAPLPVTQIAFASSGWPGNREDTRWWLDNVRLVPAVEVAALPKLALQSRDETAVAGFAWSVDESADTEPPEAATDGHPSEALAALAGRPAWLHAAALDAAGNRSEAAHILLRPVAQEDTAPPLAAAEAPAAGARACPDSISVRVSDEGLGVSPADLALTINDRRWTIADDPLTWDAAAGLLTWRLPTGVALGHDGAQVRCRLEALDLTGNALRPLEWSFTLDYAADTTPPAAPIVSYVPANVADSNDFEAGTGGWGNFVAGQVLRLAEGGATGPGCAELRHLGGGNGFVLVRDFGDGWRDHPIVRFRYRTDSPNAARLEVFGTTFDGSRDQWTSLGTLPIFGNGWLTAEVDVAQALRRTSPSLDIHRIFLSINLPPDGTMLIDDYAMHSAVATGAGFRWAAPTDASGIAGYSWALDSADDTVPPEEITGADLSAAYTDLAPGRYVLHLRACDGAGNWGPPTHLPFVLEGRQPEPPPNG